MAKTIAEIQAEIIDRKNADDNLSALDSSSATAIWRLWTRITAATYQLLELFFDTHKAEVETIIDTKRPRRAQWYQQRALDFQYGRALPEDDIFYDNTGVDVDTVEAEQIVAQAAATSEEGQLVVKVAREVSSELEPLDATQFSAFSDYMEEIKDFGVDLTYRNVAADKIKAEIDIYYDPSILNSDGERLDGADLEPVQKAAKAFLRATPFNGLFVRSHFVDALQQVEGVYVPVVRLCQATRNDSDTFTEIDVQYLPFSGYLRFFDAADLVVTFISQNDL